MSPLCSENTTSFSFTKHLAHEGHLKHSIFGLLKYKGLLLFCCFTQFANTVLDFQYELYMEMKIRVIRHI